MCENCSGQGLAQIASDAPRHAPRPHGGKSLVSYKAVAKALCRTRQCTHEFWWGENIVALIGGRNLLLQLLQEFLVADELTVENFPRDIHQLKDHRVAYGIVDRRAFFARINQIAIPQACELLRDGGLIGLQQRLQFIYAALTITQMIEDCQSCWMGECFEKVSFEGMDSLIHK